MLFFVLLFAFIWPHTEQGEKIDSNVVNKDIFGENQLCKYVYITGKRLLYFGYPSFSVMLSDTELHIPYHTTTHRSCPQPSRTVLSIPQGTINIKATEY